jgi:GT2 family glycosyltransferase
MKPPKLQADGHKVAAVVVTYNRCKLLVGALEALRNQSFGDLSIIVIDNASTDGTTETLAGLDWENLEVIRLDRNMGGAGGFAHGLEHAFNRGFDLFWVMDDDVLPEPTALDALLTTYDRLRAEGSPPGLLVSQPVSDTGEPMNVPVIDRRLSPNGFPTWPKRLKEGLVPILEASFVGVLLTRETIVKYGLPHASMFIWGDDSEYTSRICRKETCYLVANSVIVHLGRAAQLSLSGETIEDRVKLYYYFYRNNVYRARMQGWKILGLQLFRYGRDLVQVVRAGRLSRIPVLVRGVVAGFLYNPDVRYPS